MRDEMWKSYGINEFGTRISMHICDACGNFFTICPAKNQEDEGWNNCLAPNCKSYDPNRDVDNMFDDPNIEIRQTPMN
jgi:hypothetical protein